ncbi:uncharacterized protein LOC143540314 [Bidens hawaiensis]|uniref:uncharacterized protein LOC143540314 n=1 Tax=Bidens hawaiensis TaxID=980011 RepID=UPI00404B5B60
MGKNAWWFILRRLEMDAREPSTYEEVQELWGCLDILPGMVLGQGEDEWNWCHDDDGIFSTESCRSMVKNGSNITNVFVMEWNTWVPLKVNLFGWKAEMERLPTSDELHKRAFLESTNICPLCEDVLESVEHVLISCYVASVVWQFISSWCGIPPVYAFSVRDLLKEHANVRARDRRRKAIQSIILTACWCLWKTRNETLFNKTQVSIRRLKEDIKRNSFLMGEE